MSCCSPYTRDKFTHKLTGISEGKWHRGKKLTYHEYCNGSLMNKV